MKIRLIQHLRDGVVQLSFNNHTALWARRKVRKVSECCATGSSIPQGGLAYAPIGNQMYRHRRIAADYIENVMTAPKPKENP